ncbi:hypothetical protein Slala03_76900 [Streptomyces lavendulae subsp. lavendulae]|uniref:hypothetical protein n=1 Tax=Streptomyces lavendulae TaxID=1914 RepID=UPI00249FEE2B|nr:hypothetical protein [Streptomyces lavendulae]GLV88001.1 hypothetical protein Slala03_76900 [Streptomyces lavendulae subsp. lavendulae]
MKPHYIVPVALAAGLALAGCSGDPAAQDPKKPAADPAAAAVAVAREYQEATMRLDWHRACELSTVAKRHGTVEECAGRNIGPSPSPSAAQSPSASATPSDDWSPLVRADGSTVQPKAPKTKTPGPDRASLGPLTQEGQPVQVPAIGNHPAGWGVMFSYAVVWPTSTSTSREALRVVEEGGALRVDQREDAKDSDISHGNPVRDALTRG